MKSRIQKVKVFLFIFAIVIAVLVFTSSGRFNNKAHATLSGPPAARTGAPGESTCTSCHAQNAGSGQFSISAPANYAPGQTYQIQVRNVSSDQTRLSWGFELITLAGNAMAGSFANTTANTRTRVSGTKTYIMQTSAGAFPGQGGGSAWLFNWTAPATNVGNVTFYAAGLQADNDDSDSGDVTYTASAVSQPQAPVVIRHGFCDFDGDGKADPSVFRPDAGTWYINRSAQGFAAMQFGAAADKLTPADFDGDDKADIALWRSGPANQAAFYIFQSSNSALRIETFGQAGDNPWIVGDFDGDGKADPAVYRDSAVGSQSYFYYRSSLNNPSGATAYVPFGTTGDKAQRGDFDGDGKADPAVFRNGAWFINQSSVNQLRVDFWGLATDKFVPADYDGDGKTDLAVFRNGIWYVKQSSNGGSAFYPWGLSSDAPAPADYDGDGKADPAVYRGGAWYLRLSSSGSLSVQLFGVAGDIPAPGAYLN